MKIEPFGNKVLIKPDPLEDKIGSIIVPDSVKGRHDPKKKGTVIAAGIGHYAEQTGEFTPITVKEGDRVVFSAYLGEEIKGIDIGLDDETYLLLREWDIDFIMAEENWQKEQQKNITDNFHKDMANTIYS